MVFILFGVAADSAAQTCRATIFFGNGIDTLPAHADDEKNALRKIIQQKLLEQNIAPLDDACFKVAYATQGTKLGDVPIEDLIESAAQVLTDYSVFWPWLGGFGGPA